MTKSEAVFIGCNKELQISDYDSSSNLIAYGSKNTISIWNPIDKQLSSKGILKTLKSHTKHIIAVKWIPETTTLLSTSEDKTIKVWKYDPSTDSFELSQTLTGHNASVTTIAVYNKQLFVSGCADGELKIWTLNKESSQYELSESLTIKKGFYQLALALTQIAANQYVLFIGGTNTFMYVYSIVLGSKVATEQCAVLAGHEDWIRCIAIKKEREGEYLIASGSQDRYIRLWKLRLNNHIDNSDQDKTKLTLLSNKQYKFTIGEDAEQNKGALSFDAIIMGHDDWISSLIWHPTKIKLLSASSDTSIMIWEPDMTSGIWISKIRLGEMSIKGASTATGASGGFWSALWIFDKASEQELILTNGKTGSFRCWTNSNYNVEDEANFVQMPSLTGPTRSVTDLEWSPNGDYLLCTSLDQTTRLFAAYTHNGNAETKTITWHEFARPQIHGYDMICIKPLTSSRFVSAGDEKILRIFDEPRSVAQLLSKFTNVKSDDVINMPESASLPVLGLSNKAELDNVEQQHQNAQNEENDEEDPDNEEAKKNITNEILGSLETPPLEDHLQRHTLWPEIEKMYGHGYEITTLDISPDGKLIASACRSNVASHAVIRIFRTDTWLQLPQTLAGHELTITRLRWSFNNKYLLAVSRDRSYSLWERKDTVNEDGKENTEFKLLMLKPKAHSRIVWDCCWLPESIGDGMFITVSRDKVLRLWKKNEVNEGESVKLIGNVKVDKPLTALDSYKYAVDGKCIIAVGLETGGVLIYSVGDDGEFKLLQKVEDDFIPSERVNKVAFNVTGSDQNLLLAIGSVDNSVRILSFGIKDLVRN